MEPRPESRIVTRTKNVRMRFCFVSLCVFAGSFASAQVRLAGQIIVHTNVQSFSNKAFSVGISDAGSLKEGDQLPAQVGGDTVYSMDKEDLTVGGVETHYPILAIVDGKAVWPAVLEAKTDIGAGQTLHVGGYVVQSERAIKTGGRILVLVISGDSVLSISKDKPWFTAFKEGTTQDHRAADISAWQKWRFHPDL